MNYNTTTTGETQDYTEGNDVCYKKKRITDYLQSTTY